MKKDDYKTEFEEQRQEININGENEQGDIPSRVELHSKSRTSKKRSGPKLVNILFALFPLIPVGILIFVIFSWDSPKEKPMEGVEDSQFQFETSDKNNQKDSLVDDKKEKEQQDAIKKNEEAKKEIEEQAKKEQAEAEAKKAAEDQVKKEQAEEQKAQEEQAKKEEENKPASQTHTVAAGETLYRISVNYYKSGDGVSKIIQANGLTSNEIVTGQTLIIP